MFSRKFFATFCCFSLFCSAPKCQGSALGVVFKVIGGLEIMGGVSQAVTSMFTPDNRNIVSEEQKSKELVEKIVSVGVGIVTTFHGVINCLLGNHIDKFDEQQKVINENSKKIEKLENKIEYLSMK